MWLAQRGKSDRLRKVLTCLRKVPLFLRKVEFQGGDLACKTPSHAFWRTRCLPFSSTLRALVWQKPKSRTVINLVFRRGG